MKRQEELWKGNYLDYFLDNYPNLVLSSKLILEYLDCDNKDMIFLLEKKCEHCTI